VFIPNVQTGRQQTLSGRVRKSARPRRTCCAVTRAAQCDGTVGTMSTVILPHFFAPILHRRRRTIAPMEAKTFQQDTDRWSVLGRQSAAVAATKLLFSLAPLPDPHPAALPEMRVAYTRVDHAQIAIHHEDHVVSRQRPRDGERELVWTPQDDIDLHLMELAGRPVRPGRDYQGRITSMSAVGSGELPRYGDLIRVVEQRLGYRADSAQQWPLIVTGTPATGWGVQAASARRMTPLHLLLGKERLRTLDLRNDQIGDVRPYEHLRRARTLGYDAAIFHEALISGTKGLTVVPAVALFTTSQPKLSQLTIPAHPYDWSENTAAESLTPDFLTWHHGMQNTRVP